jgi:hypothetical protein
MIMSDLREMSFLGRNTSKLFTIRFDVSLRISLGVTDGDMRHAIYRRFSNEAT